MGRTKDEMDVDSESSTSGSSDEESSEQSDDSSEHEVQPEHDDDDDDNDDDDDDDDDDDEGENFDGDHDVEDGVEKNTDNTVRSSATLSKSWTIASAHVPTFTGGKVTFCTNRSIPEKHDGKEEENIVEDDDDQQQHEKQHSFLFLPVEGDLAVVDANRGVKLGTLRGEDGSQYEDDLEEDEGLDQDAISAYACSHNNQFVVTCSRNQLLRQYAINTTHVGEIITTTTKLNKSFGRSGHTLPVTHMEFHPSSVFLATGSVDGTVRIWDVRGAYLTHVFRPVAGGDGGGSGRLSITSLAWKNNKFDLILAIGRDDGSIIIHNLRGQSATGATGDSKSTVTAVLRDHVSSVTCMSWWSSSRNKSNNNKKKKNDNEDDGKEYFISTGRDAVLNLWSIVVDDSSTTSDKKRKKKRKKKNDETMTSTQVSYRRIQTIPLYEEVEGMVILPCETSSNGTPNRDLIVATAGSKGLIRMWKATVTPDRVPEFSLHQEETESQSFGEARGGYTGLVLSKISDNNDSNSRKTEKQPQLITVDAEHNLSFLSSTDLLVDRTIVGHNDEILDLKMLPNSNKKSHNNKGRIVVATNSSQIRIFDLETFSCSVFDGHSATVLCVETSPCGRYFASCGKDKTMRLWRVDDYDDDDNNNNKPSKKCVAIATGHTEPIGACGLSRKVGPYEVGGKAAMNGGGAFAITASVDRTLKRWNLPGTDELPVDDEEAIALKAASSVRGHEKDINIVSVAPNDSLVATGSQDKTVKLWKSTDLSLKATLQGHRRGVWDCQFSPVDRVLATSSGDKTIKLWSLSDYACVRTFQGHLASVLRVRFLSGGLQLMSAGADGLLKLWTIRTNDCEATLDGHSDKVWAMDLGPPIHSQSSSDTLAMTVISGGADSRLILWQDNTQQVEDDKRAQEAEIILLDQKLANHIRYKEFDKALDIALQVEKPMHVLKVITSIVEEDLKTKRQNGLASLQKHVSSWTMDRTAQVLKYCREWNTRARNSHIAMLVVKAVVTSIPASKLAATNGIPELMAGILPYAERHFDRLDRLYASSYLLDFALKSMGTYDDTDLVLDNIDEKKQQEQQKEFESWEASSKLVLPSKFVDGRIQIGGKAIIGERATISADDDSSRSDEDDYDEVVTIGESSSSSSEDSSDDDDEKMEDVPSKKNRTKKSVGKEASSSSGTSSSDGESSDGSSSSNSS